MKKKIPLIIHELLEEFLPLEDNVFKVLYSENFILKVSDDDPNSDFYFHIEEIKNEGAKKIIIDYKPCNTNTVINRTESIEPKNIHLFFKQWIELLQKYQTVKSFYDDPIAEAYAEEYYSEFEILEEPDKPFKTNQILFLDEYLEKIQENIEKHATEKNNAAIQEIKNDVITLRENLTSHSKAWVAKNLSKIWGKLAKQGTKFIKEFMTEAKKQVIENSVKFLIQNGPQILKEITESQS